MKSLLSVLCVLCMSCVMVHAEDAGPVKQREFKPMKPGVWFGHYGEYRNRAKEVKKTAEAHFELGQWAYEHGLEDEAWEQWIEAVGIEPGHAKTRKVMGFVKTDATWGRRGKLNKEWLKLVEADGRALSVEITIEDDADEKFFAEFKWRLLRLNWFLWQITEGQLYLKNVTVKDNATGGRFVIQKGKLDIPVLKGGGAFCRRSGRPNWQVFSGGRCYVRILAHEMCHGVFGLPDERHGCYCLMQGGLYGVKTHQLVMCDKDTHVHHRITPVACWDLIQKRYPKMKHPNPVKYGKVPEPIVKIIDTDSASKK